MGSHGEMGRFATGEIYGVTGRSLLLFELQTAAPVDFFEHRPQPGGHG